MRRPKLTSSLASIVLLMSASSSCAKKALQEVYRDPAGRFTVAVPHGWTAEPQGDGVVVTHGGAMAVVAPFPGAKTGRQVVTAVSRQYGAQWKKLAGVDKGDFQLAGKPASFAVFSGTNPKGVDALLRIAGLAQGGDAFVLIISVPKTEFDSVKGALQVIEKSLSLGGGAADARVAANPPSGARSVAATSGNYHRMRWGRIMDERGFAQPMESSRLLVPADWKLTGGVTWDPNTSCMFNMIHISARALSPDGRAAIEFFDPYMWQWNDDPTNVQMARQQAQQTAQMMGGRRSCEMRPAMSAASFIRQMLVTGARRGARVTGEEQMPQVAEAQREMLQKQYAQLIQAGYLRGLGVDAAKVKLAYEIDGRPVEEWITGMVIRSAMPSYSASAAMRGQMAQAMAYTFQATNLIAVRAPAGELERQSKLYATMIASVRPNPQWMAAVEQVRSNMNKVAAQGAADRAAIQHQTQSEINDIINSSYRDRQEVQDRIAARFSQTIREVETFVDPSTNERTELSAGYHQAWSNGKGEYILSDDANFDPSVVFQESWKELKRAEKP